VLSHYFSQFANPSSIFEHKVEYGAARTVELEEGGAEKPLTLENRSE